MNNGLGYAAAAIGVAAMLGSAAAAQPAPVLANGTLLTLTAEGRTTRAPDVAEVSGGVVTVAPTAAAAMRDNAAKMTAVVAAVKQAGIADRDIQTTGLSLQPQYRYDNNAPPVLCRGWCSISTGRGWAWSWCPSARSPKFRR